MPRRPPPVVLAALLAAVLAATVPGAAGCGDGRGTRARFTLDTMGTVARCDLRLPADLDAAAARALVAAVYDSVTAVLDAHDPGSELGRLNAAPAGTPVPVSPWLARCLRAARDLRDASGGAFDPAAGPLTDLWRACAAAGRLPRATELDSARTLLGGWTLAAGDTVVRADARTRLDLGGIAKGLAVDLATAALDRAGVRDGLVDLGGNLFCRGGAPGRDDWRVAVRDPSDRDRHLATLRLRDRAVATSGAYERFVVIGDRRYGHVLNPATGRPAAGLLSATVVAPTALAADGLSTALFVLGPEGARRLLAAREDAVEAVLVADGEAAGPLRVFVTAGLRDRLALLPEAAARCSLVVWD